MYLGFSSMKRLRAFLLPPEWDASPLQGYPPALNLLNPFIHLGGERHHESNLKRVLPKNTTQYPGPGLINPDCLLQMLQSQAY